MRIKMTRCLHSLLLSVALSSYNVREREGRRKREQEGGDRGGQRERRVLDRILSQTATKKKKWAIKNVYDTRSGQPPKKVASGMWHVAECVAYD